MRHSLKFHDLQGVPVSDLEDKLREILINEFGAKLKTAPA